MTLHFFTYFDSGYLIRGLALYESLTRVASSFELTVLTLDDRAESILRRMALPFLNVLPVRELEAADPELSESRPNRSRIEYYFTCTSALTRHLLRERSDVAYWTYVDADLYFFSDPRPLYDLLGGGSIGIVEHRYPAGGEHRLAYGRFNVGWITFRNDSRAYACVQWWRERCLEWCYDRVEADRFADQKYLDRWPELFPGTVILNHPGANLAPWNVARHQVSLSEDGPLVDGQPLIFYHFTQLKQLRRSIWILGLRMYEARASPVLLNDVYVPYIRAIGRATRLALEAGGNTTEVSSRIPMNAKLRHLLKIPSLLRDREIVFVRW